jgi:hypothetical protein
MLDTNLHAAVLMTDETIVFAGHDAMAREQADPRLLHAALKVHRLDALEITAQQNQHRHRAGLEGRGAVEHRDHVGANLSGFGFLRRIWRLQQRDDAVRNAVAPAIVDEFDVVNRADDVLVRIETVDDLVGNDVARNRVAILEQSASRKIMPLARFGTPASP